jgi:hypothetical protein
VAQATLRILERAVVLEIGSPVRRITWNVMSLSGISTCLAIGRTRQRRKFFAQRGTPAFPFPTPEGRERQRLG